MRQVYDGKSFLYIINWFLVTVVQLMHDKGLLEINTVPRVKRRHKAISLLRTWGVNQTTSLFYSNIEERNNMHAKKINHQKGLSFVKLELFKTEKSNNK